MFSFPKTVSTGKATFCTNGSTGMKKKKKQNSLKHPQHEKWRAPKLCSNLHVHLVVCDVMYETGACSISPWHVAFRHARNQTQTHWLLLEHCRIIFLNNYPSSRLITVVLPRKVPLNLSYLHFLARQTDSTKTSCNKMNKSVHASEDTTELYHRLALFRRRQWVKNKTHKKHAGMQRSYRSEGERWERLTSKPITRTWRFSSSKTLSWEVCAVGTKIWHRTGQNNPGCPSGCAFWEAEVFKTVYHYFPFRHDGYDSSDGGRSMRINRIVLLPFAVMKTMAMMTMLGDGGQWDST